MPIFDEVLMEVAGWLPAPWPYLAYGALVALFAGAVRGFAGFGLSAFIVAGMSLWISLQRIVPSAMMLEVVASVSLLRSVWHHISWRWVGPLLAGYAVSVPAGVWCLTVLPEVPLRAAVSTVILSAALALLTGFHPRWRDTIALRLGTGLASGFLSGLSAIGGMVAAVMLFSGRGLVPAYGAHRSCDRRNARTRASPVGAGVELNAHDAAKPLCGRLPGATIAYIIRGPSARIAATGTMRP